MVPTANKTDPASKPTQGTPVAQKRTMTQAEAVVELARRGHTSVLPQLKEIFDARPDLWRNVGHLTRVTQQVWLDRICAANLHHGQAVRRQLEALREELAGPAPTPIEEV